MGKQVSWLNIFLSQGHLSSILPEGFACGGVESVEMNRVERPVLLRHCPKYFAHSFYLIPI